MANTYTQIHIQVVFAVQNRQSLIAKAWNEELYRYITGIIQNHGHKLLRINGVSDHIHILFGMRPTQALSELVQHVKQDSSKWIKQKGFVPGRFSWQEGYGAFSYSKRDVPNVIAYIDNQEEHHRKQSFQEEYVEFLKDFEIEHDERYIFKAVE
jgi:REP element-mobilizing transposase RayT